MIGVFGRGHIGTNTTPLTRWMYLQLTWQMFAASFHTSTGTFERFGTQHIQRKALSRQQTFGVKETTGFSVIPV